MYTAFVNALENAQPKCIVLDLLFAGADNDAHRTNMYHVYKSW